MGDDTYIPCARHWVALLIGHKLRKFARFFVFIFYLKKIKSASCSFFFFFFCGAIQGLCIFRYFSPPNRSHCARIYDLRDPRVIGNRHRVLLYGYRVDGACVNVAYGVLLLRIYAVAKLSDVNSHSSKHRTCRGPWITRNRGLPIFPGRESRKNLTTLNPTSSRALEMNLQKRSLAVTSC